MKTSSAKAKGRKLCKEVKELIHDNNPELHHDDVLVTASGQNGEDIQLSPLARGFLPISIECKAQERLNIWAAIEQAENNASHFSTVVIFRKNRSKTYAVIEADTLFELLRLKYEEEVETITKGKQ
jgi:hypothetical protein